MNRSERISIFCTEIWSWYFLHKRTLPWRDLSDDDPELKAYKVLVSEIMLQQTQVFRVIVSYKNFIQQFPHIEALSKATNREILIAWRGLGYNNRALRFRDAARVIVRARPLSPTPFPRGEKGALLFPTSMEDLQKLPGVGHYTAGAIRNFAFGIPTPCLDVNIRRILHRFFVGIENADGTWKKDDAYLLELSEEVLIEALRTGSTSDWHAALMDFGSMVMTKNSPKWDQLSPGMKSICMAYGREKKRAKKLIKKEPGRLMAGKFVPNRIFRGRIIEALRDARTKLTIEQLGSQAIADWTMGDHREWLKSLVEGLKRERMIEEKKGRFVLAD